MKYLAATKTKKAMSHFEKALLINNSIENYYFYSISLIDTNKYVEAIGFLEKIVEKHDDIVLISTTLIDCYLYVKEWEKAERLVNILMDKFPNHHYVNKLYNITLDIVYREKYVTAKISYHNAVALIEKKEFKAAFTEISCAIEIDPTNATYHFVAGTILVSQKKKKEEIKKYFEKAVLLSPKNEYYKKNLMYIKTRYR